jgi:hypothetical protein
VPDEPDLWRTALATDDPVTALRTAVRARLAAGDTREQVTGQLTRLVLDLREEGRPDEHEDPVLDVLDMLAGWCAPGAAL